MCGRRTHWNIDRDGSALGVHCGTHRGWWCTRTGRCAQHGGQTPDPLHGHRHGCASCTAVSGSQQSRLSLRICPLHHGVTTQRACLCVLSVGVRHRGHSYRARERYLLEMLQRCSTYALQGSCPSFARARFLARGKTQLRPWSWTPQWSSYRYSKLWSLRDSRLCRHSIHVSMPLHPYQHVFCARCREL